MQQEQERTITPTEADKMQLSLDYLSAPEAYEAAQRFYGKYIDELEDFREEVENVQQQEKTARGMEAYSNNLRQVMDVQTSLVSVRGTDKYHVRK